MKMYSGAAVGLMALAMSGMAFGQGMSGSSQMDSAKISQSYQSTELNGMSVQNRNKEDLGTISDLIIDKDGKVSNVVLQEGGVAGIGGNHYLVPWDRVQLTPDQEVAIIDVNKNRLSSEFAAFEQEKTDKQERGTQMRKDGKPSATSPRAQ